MYKQAILLATCFSLIAAAQVATIDLSESSAEFPTNSVSARGCNAAFDSGNREPPASCFPSPITIEIEGVQAKAGDRAGFTLVILITNVGDHPIQLPRAPEPTVGGGKSTFITLDVYSPPGSLISMGESLAFADTMTASSVVNLEQGASVIYRLPFKKALPKTGAASKAENPQIEVRLSEFWWKKGSNGQEDVSAQQGNDILSKPYIICSPNEH